MKSALQRNESGYILAGVIMLLALSAMIVAASLNYAASDSRTILAMKRRSTEYYTAEDSLNRAATWLRAQNQNLASCFNRANFYTAFKRTSPTVGANDTSVFTVPTKIKMQGTNNSVILTNSNSLATAAFPATTNVITGAAYNAVTQFPNAPLGQDVVRVTMVDAIAINPASDFGDPALGNAPPQTDFFPVYRVDSMKGLTQGGHVYAYDVGKLLVNYGVAFYGQNFINIHQPCDSYISNNGPYGGANVRANCIAGSNATASIQQSKTLYGTLSTNGTIDNNPPNGGPVCADFVAGCPHHGSTCQGASCHVPGLPVYSAWNVYCPVDQGNVTPANGATLTVAGNNANQKCWNTVTVGNNTTVNLTTTVYTYFINTLNIAHNGTLNFAPNPNNGTITLYVQNLNGGSINGNQVLNTNNKPYQLRIHYLGNTSLTMNGSAAINAFMIAPYASVTVQGNFTYSGGLKALDLTFTGSGNVHYDESGSISTINGVQYTIRNAMEHYR
jgi:hypothetical protein